MRPRSFRTAFASRCLPAVLLAAPVVSGCEGRAVTAVDVAALEVRPAEGSLSPGRTLQLTATTLDRAGRPLEREVVWTSEDEAVASVSETGLVEGRGPGTTRVTASSGRARGEALIAVTGAPHIGVSATEVRFEETEGARSTHSREIRISNAGEGTLEGLSASVSYEGEGEWLEVELADTTAPTSATLQTRAGSLPSGLHRATVRFEAALAENSPVAVNVVLEIREALPELLLSSTAVGFVWEQGRAGPPPRTLTVRSDDGEPVGRLETSILYEGQARGWLAADLDRTSTPAALTLRVFPQAFSPGEYDGVVRVSSPEARNEAEVRVRLTVGERRPRIGLERTGVQFSMERDGPVPDPVSIEIENIGGGVLEDLRATVSHPSGPSGWLDVRLSRSTAPAELVLSVDESDLPSGRYDALVEVSAPDADNSPRSVQVRLEVDHPAPVVRVGAVHYATAGFLGRNLRVTVSLVDEAGGAVSGAGVSIRIANLDRNASWTGTGNTGTHGTITFGLDDHPTGCYEVTVTRVSAPGMVWNGETPANSYCRRW
jgi:hypothetical protein